MKVRDLLKHMVANGCVAQRQNGSHQIWMLPNGVTFPVVVHHKNADVSLCVMATVKRLLREAGISL